MSEAATHAVFLSYARDDATAARRIAEALRASGLKVWFDENELRGGDTWDAKIRKQIDACALFLPLISTHTQERSKGYFRLEWKLAVDQTHLLAEGVPFLAPVVIDDTREADAIVPPEFMKVQWTRLPGALPTPQFVEQVKRLMSRKTVAEVVDPGSATRRPGSTTPATKKSLPGWTWGALAAVVVGVAVALGVFRRPAPPPVSDLPPPASSSALPAGQEVETPPAKPKLNPKSIAVLPFENRSEVKGDVYFTDGIHDDLLTQIARIKDIKTISRTSVMAYRNTAKNMRTIGEELGVATILEGGVQRAGNQVRINMQLIDARTDEHLWAETYTREMTAENIFAIQSEIAAAIAKALSAVLSPEEQQQLDHRATASLAALEQYFAANALARDGNTEKMERAVPLYQEAIRLDPAFAPAYAKLAELYLSQIYLSGLPSEIQVLKAEPLIDRALQLDPRLSEAYVARGSLLYYREDYSGARAAYERAIELKPNNDAAYINLANLLFWSSTTPKEQALALGRRAQELNPGEPGVNRSVANFLMQMGRSEGRVIVEKLVRDDPRDALSLALLGYADCNSQNLIAGFVNLRKAYALDPGSAVIADALFDTCSVQLGDEAWVKFWLERSVAATRVGKVPLDTRLRLLIAGGKLAEADALWTQEWKTDRRSNTSVVLWELMMADIKAGRNLAPQARYLQSNPGLFATDPKVIDLSDDLFRAKDVALALIAAGKRGQAEQLLEKVGTVARGHTEYLYRFILAKVQLAQGDRKGFFQTLRELIDRKAPLEKLYFDPEFAVYHQDPEFEALFGDVPRQRAELVATLHRMDASGELAPIPPLPERKQ